MKGCASLLKSLTRLDRCSRMCLARFDTDSGWTPRSGDTDELAHTAREIIRVQWNMMKLSRELASAFGQIRRLVAGKARCLAMPEPVAIGSRHAGNRKADGREGRRRFAFTAIATDTGAAIVRVLADTSAFCPQEEYGCFETWTEAQDFASVLNQMYGIEPMEAQHIVVGATLVRSCK